MFAIAIWDNCQDLLILARDRVGKKPLYYYEDEEKLLFASELKSICQYPDTISASTTKHYLSTLLMAS